MNNKNVIYIAGYGRSGSTLLEMILSLNDKVYSLGEITNFNDCVASNSLCSCGINVKDCDFWSRVINKYDTYNMHNKDEKLFKAIVDSLPDEIEYVVDSSKTARKSRFRPFRLHRIFKNNFYMIHIVRDGRGCISSLKKGSNKKIEKGINPKLVMPVLRGTVGWFNANVSAHIFGLFNKDKYYFLRYEDFVLNPEIELTKLSYFLFNLSNTNSFNYNKESILPCNHQISGNRLRNMKTISMVFDEKWKREINPFDNFIFLLLNRFLLKKYKYDIKFYSNKP